MALTVKEKLVLDYIARHKPTGAEGIDFSAWYQVPANEASARFIIADFKARMLPELQGSQADLTQQLTILNSQITVLQAV